MASNINNNFGFGSNYSGYSSDSSESSSEEDPNFAHLKLRKPPIFLNPLSDTESSDNENPFDAISSKEIQTEKSSKKRTRNFKPIDSASMEDRLKLLAGLEGQSLIPVKKIISPESTIEAMCAAIKEKTRSLNITYCKSGDYPNRFDNTFLPLETAFKGIPGKTYIFDYPLHASHIEHPESSRSFIASQAPSLDDFIDFWTNIAFHGHAIVDLTTEKDWEKEDPYFPTELNETLDDGCKVTLIEKAGFLNTYQVVIQDETTGQEIVQVVKRYNSNAWADGKALTLDSFKELISDLELHFTDLENNINQPLWIHCKAGLGRTGTVITALVMKDLINKGIITNDNLSESLVDLIISFRAMRGLQFVQTKEQLELLYSYAKSLL